MNQNIVIIGAGQAGLTAALSLREQGWNHGLYLIGDENRTPYQRPPLSKGYLSGIESTDDLALCTNQVLLDRGVTTHFGVEAVQINRLQKLITLSDGSTLDYQWLIFATGSTPRQLDLPGHKLSGIHTIRKVQDADSLQASFKEGGRTLFIGGGFLNLEVAFEASQHGPTTVLELAPQLLGRALSRPAADELQRYHQQRGVDVRCGIQIAEILGSDGAVSGVRLSTGEVISAARIVASIGATARDELAAQAGLETAGGIVVDAYLRTGDDSVFAIGDCATYPNMFSGSSMRVESVQNATDQARHVAAFLTNNSQDCYRAVPWFWSTQGDRRLQIAGLALPDDANRVVERDHRKGKLVVERLRGDQVVAVETINAPGPHMKARKSISAAMPPSTKVGSHQT